jgi:hypothetical protein
MRNNEEITSEGITCIPNSMKTGPGILIHIKVITSAI